MIVVTNTCDQSRWHRRCDVGVQAGHTGTGGGAELLAEVFGTAGQQARPVVSVSSLPADIASEVQAIIAVLPA